jgi:hypothetical protein
MNLGETGAPIDETEDIVIKNNLNLSFSDLIPVLLTEDERRSNKRKFVPDYKDVGPKPNCAVLRVNRNGTTTVTQSAANPLVNAMHLDFLIERIVLAVEEFGPFETDQEFDFSSNDTPFCHSKFISSENRYMGGCCRSGRPLLGMARNVCCNCSLPVPMHGNQRQRSIQEYRNITDPFEWKDKESLAVWHGANHADRHISQVYTDMFNMRRSWMTPREQIVHLSEQHPSLLNASFTKFDWKEILRYKYIVSVSGFAFAGLLKPALLSNSCVLRQDPIATEWYETWLVPFVHFVPVKYDLSDLIEKIEWAKEHDEECSRIAQQGRAFAEKYFQDIAINAYVHAAISGKVPLG